MSAAEQPLAGLDADELFAAQRPRLVGLAYRLLGSRADAEDVVQEAWVRWHRAERATLDSPAAWLTTVVSRIGIDRLRARQRDQADYVGPWLPEPIVSFADEPADAAELSDSLSTAFLVLMERLSPHERVVLLLADVFQQPFAAVAEVIGKTEAATRQMAVRARRKVRTDADVSRPSRAEQLDVAGAFVAAIMAGDHARVQALMTPDAVLVSDGGAHRHAARRAVLGPERISRLLINLARRFSAVPDNGATFRSGWVNGQPGLVISVFEEPYWVACFDIKHGQVDRFYMMLNPDKIGAINRPVDLV
ncbi:MAG TPA: RNA polymerase sigma factor SigJ [Ilumatobacteraceae bacterium]